MKPGTVLTVWMVGVWSLMELWDGWMPTASLLFLATFLITWQRLPLQIRRRFEA